MKKLLLVLCIGIIAMPLSILAQEQIEAYGFTYFAPPEAVGTVVTVVAFLEPPIGFTYPFSVDFATYEYTLYLETTITSWVSGMFSIDITYADCDFYIYEDASKNGIYGSNPPNGTSPSTFQDGNMILSGRFTNLIRSDDPFGFFEPTIFADCEMTGGTKFSELIQGSGWSMHGGLLNDPSDLPTGYQQGWVSKIFFTGPVSTEDSTWGRIKYLFQAQ